MPRSLWPEQPKKLLQPLLRQQKTPVAEVAETAAEVAEPVATPEPVAEVTETAAPVAEVAAPAAEAAPIVEELLKQLLRLNLKLLP
jgi:hypothetical protein